MALNGDRLTAHLAALGAPLQALENELVRIEDWGAEAARVLLGGGRLLAAGNGGSAAQAQHLTSELVGRYQDERLPLSAIALCTEPSSLTAIGNDYGLEEAFSRQVRAHGRPGDVFVGLSTSGRSPNVIAAAATAKTCGMTVWALAGRGPNPLTEIADDAVSIEASATATVQEIHLVVVHLLCEAVEAEIGLRVVGQEVAR
jgi:D-sedoheptulose 7-phosphate isomerase